VSDLLPAGAKRGRPARIGPADILNVVNSQIDGHWTIGTVAAELGVTTAAVYHHYPSKEAIVAALVDRTIGELDLPVYDGDWKNWLRAVGRYWHGFLEKHPFLLNEHAQVELAMRRNGAPVFTAIMDALTAAGFSLVNGWQAYSVVTMLAFEHARLGHLATPSLHAAMDQWMAMHGGSPAATTVGAISGDVQALLETALEIAVTGIEHTFHPARAAGSERSSGKQLS
jgi:AcrR family transcriptional regulator